MSEEQPVRRIKPGRVPMGSDKGEAVLDAYEAGSLIVDACASNGCSPAAFLGWLEKNPDEKSRYAALRRARALVLADKLEGLTDGVMTGNADPERLSASVVNSIKWRTAGLAPEEYGERQTIKHEVKREPTEIETKASEMSDEEALAMIEASKRQLIEKNE